MELDKRTLRREYKETPRPAGVFAVRNVPEALIFAGTSPDVPSMLNRQRFQLEMGVHPVKQLQADWVRLGPDAFVFEMLDKLEPPKDDAKRDLKEDLATLWSLWQTRLTSDGLTLYPGISGHM